MQKISNSPYLLLVLATLFWAGNFTIGKVIVASVPPITLALIRWGISIIIFTPFAIEELKKQKKLLLKNWRIILLFTLTGIVLFNTLVYISVQYTSPVNASLMNALTPSLILLLAFFWLKESLDKLQIFGMIISFIGVVWMIIHGSIQQLLTLSFNQGDLTMILAVLSWGIYSVMMKRYGPQLPTKATFLLTMLIGEIILLPLSIHEWSTFSFIGLGFSQYIEIFYLGIFPSVLAFLSWNRAVFLIGPTKAGIYLNLIVVFAAIIAAVFLKEVITIDQIIGGLLVFLGVYITTHFKTAEVVNRSEAPQLNKIGK